jgi:hypothetical protein
MARLFRFRLLSLMLLVLAIAIVLGVYSARRRHAMKSWTETTGLWKLTLIAADAYVEEDVPDLYLHIDGRSIESVDLNSGIITTSNVIPRIRGFDFDAPDGNRTFTLYECADGILTMHNAEPGGKRPSRIPSRSSVGKGIRVEFERVSQENLDQAMAKIEAQRRLIETESPTDN